MGEAAFEFECSLEQVALGECCLASAQNALG